MKPASFSIFSLVTRDEEGGIGTPPVTKAQQPLLPFLMALTIRSRIFHLGRNITQGWADNFGVNAMASYTTALFGQIQISHYWSSNKSRSQNGENDNTLYSKR